MTLRKQARSAELAGFPNPARIQQDVEAAMRALPLQQPPGPGWSSILASEEAVISSLAEKYVDMALASAAAPTAPTRREVVARLARVKEQAAALLDSLRQLDGTSVDALHLAIKANRPLRATIDRPPKALGDIRGRLEALIDAVNIAEIQGAVKDHKGPDRKLDALEIAKAAARDFNFLTGNPPTRSKNRDGFPVFLTAIFEALDRRDDSVESLARQACEWWNSGGADRDDLLAIEKRLASPPANLDDGPIALPDSWWQRCHLNRWTLEE